MMSDDLGFELVAQVFLCSTSFGDLKGRGVRAPHAARAGRRTAVLDLPLSASLCVRGRLPQQVGVSEFLIVVPVVEVGFVSHVWVLGGSLGLQSSWWFTRARPGPNP